MPTKTVLQELKSAQWFGKLSDDDRSALYAKSRRRVVDSVIKFSRKNLVIRNEIYPVGQGMPTGTWKATKKGLERFAKEKEGWIARYRIHDAILEEKS